MEVYLAESGRALGKTEAGGDSGSVVCIPEGETASRTNECTRTLCHTKLTAIQYANPSRILLQVDSSVK